jgi:putative addiction module component (TIGR02574 family)
VGQPLQNPPPGFDELTVEEKLAYVRQLWARVLSSEEVGLSDAQEAELKRRVAAHRAEPSAAVPWTEVRRALWTKHGSRDK